MTVKELIEHLQTLPQDFPVLYRMHSDFSILEALEITVQNDADRLAYGVAVAHHNMPGEFRSYSGEKSDPMPNPAGVVIFPGN